MEEIKKHANSIEKRVTSVENCMDALERKRPYEYTYGDKFYRYLDNFAQQNSVINSSERIKNRERLRNEREKTSFWKFNFFMAALLLVVLAVLSNVYATAQEPKIPQDGPVVQYLPDDGRLPGDDVPATDRCYMAPDEIEAAENEMIEAALLANATRLDNVTVTHYDCCFDCCGKTDGITASGVRATPGVTVAVDPDVIPLGADVLVDYGDGDIKYYRADDVGGAIQGNRIDLCVSSHQEALELGRRTATVWWVMPE